MSRMSRGMKEEWKTYGNVFDSFTLRTLFKLSSEGHFDSADELSPLFIGKESNVFLAKKGNEKIIIKIYRLETCDFSKMYSYIKYDPRYSKLKKNRRRIIFSWVQREYRNLFKAREAGCNVPKPIAFLNNILVLSMIGKDGPAPKLKDSYPKYPKKFFDLLIDQVKKLYKAGIIHADLSPFNVLNLDETPFLIDMSQSTILDNQRAEEFLERDMGIIVNFFNKLNIQKDKEETLNEIRTKKGKS